MRSITVLQARTSSSRLPAKVLLPVGGLPLAVLAAKRAANTGREVVVATSDGADDDALARLVQQHGIRCHRGSLGDVLQRMADAAADLPDDALFVRLTADNVFPDGALLDQVERDFLTRGLDYLACNGEPSGLPYGVSCEVTRLGHLREAARHASAASDREHVTPYVIRKFGAAWFTQHRGLGKGHFRCTVDSYDDYVNVQRVFAGVADPVGAPLAELVQRLEGTAWQPTAPCPVPRLVIGTAQLGIPYGIANAQGIPDDREAEFILKTAIANGASWVDTARAYGRSEAVVGQAMAGGWSARVRVATKLSPLTECAADASTALVEARVDASVFESCARLRVQRLEALLLHRAAHLHMWQGAAWRRLLQLREDGTIGTLGVSVQNPAELEQALEVPEVGIVQLPCNLLDWRWEAVHASIARRKERNPLVLHVRSALLQGLLCSRDPAHWRRAHVPEAHAAWDWLDSARAAHRSADLAELCLRYVRSLPWVDGVVVGMESGAQVLANIRHFNTPLLSQAELAQLDRTRPRLPEGTLDPARWLKD